MDLIYGFKMTLCVNFQSRRNTQTGMDFIYDFQRTFGIFNVGNDKNVDNYDNSVGFTWILFGLDYSGHTNLKHLSYIWIYCWLEII